MVRANYSGRDSHTVGFLDSPTCPWPSKRYLWVMGTSRNSFARHVPTSAFPTLLIPVEEWPTTGTFMIQGETRPQKKGAQIPNMNKEFVKYILNWVEANFVRRLLPSRSILNANLLTPSLTVFKGNRKWLKNWLTHSHNLHIVMVTLSRLSKLSRNK